MRVLCPIVEAVANLVPIGCADVILRSRIGSKRVGDDNLGRPYPFMIRLRNFSAAALSRFAMTTASKIFPFGQPFRPRHALRLRPQNFVSRVAPGVAYRSHALPALCQSNASTQIGLVQARRLGPSMATMRNDLNGGGSRQAH